MNSLKPNFVFNLTDDMRKDDLKYMPKTRALLTTQGMQFQNAYVSNPLCCPSRATIMRGQYAHKLKSCAADAAVACRAAEGGAVVRGCVMDGEFTPFLRSLKKGGEG